MLKQHKRQSKPVSTLALIKWLWLSRSLHPKYIETWIWESIGEYGAFGFVLVGTKFALHWHYISPMHSFPYRKLNEHPKMYGQIEVPTKNQIECTLFKLHLTLCDWSVDMHINSNKNSNNNIPKTKTKKRINRCFMKSMGFLVLLINITNKIKKTLITFIRMTNKSCRTL